MTEDRRAGGWAGSQTRQWVLWFSILALATLGMLTVRAHLEKAHITLIFLLVVLGASAGGGRMLGTAVVTVAFLTFNFFFLPPYATLIIANPVDWMVLASFAATSLVAAQLLHRARREAQDAEERASEVDRLATLGAETLNAPDAHDGLQAIVEVIRTSLDVDECDVFERHGSTAQLAASSRAGVGDESHTDAARVAAGDLVEWIVRSGHRAEELRDGTVRVAEGSTVHEARAVALPLQVRGAVVGVLRVARATGLRQTPEWRRLLEALAYYAALGVERVRLTTYAQRVEAERRLEALRNAFLTSVSHDLRTPLTAIRGIAHEIGEGGPPEAAREIEAEVERLNHLIGDMLELSRIQAGVIRPEGTVNTIDDLLGTALQQCRVILHGRDVRVETPADALLAGRFSLADSVRVLVNLLENAVKYSPTSTPLLLRAWRDDGWLRISVRDHGSGVPVAERERIFEPFYRPSGVPSDVGGTGLGLSIARGLAEAQGGALRYVEPSDGGAEFVYSVPSADAPSEP